MASEQARFKQQHRESKALSPAEVEGYLAGAGMGLAKAAELNRYPGPRHVLDLADALELTNEQRKETQEFFDRMQARARKLVELEQALDRAFAEGTLDAERLGELTSAIGEREAAIRRTHLEAHLEQRAVLDESQVERYVELRGYGHGKHKHAH